MVRSAIDDAEAGMSASFHLRLSAASRLSAGSLSGGRPRRVPRSALSCRLRLAGSTKVQFTRAGVTP
jgi:hypothetical protein